MTRLKVARLDAIASAVSSPETKQVMIILAPNFEERSVHCCRELLDMIDAESTKARISWIVLTLQGRHSPTFLDAIKAVNVRRVLGLLHESGHANDLDHRTLEYPMDQGKFISELALLIRGIAAIDELIVDYSALPRNLLSALIEEVEASSGGARKFPRVKSVSMLYAWAVAYPKASGPELLGEVVGHFSRLPLRSLLEGRDHAEVVIFAAGTTHDAFSLLESLRGHGMGNQIGIHLVNFMHTDNLLESRLKLRSHYTLIRDAPQQGVQVRYVFNPRHALAYMRDVAKVCVQASEDGARSLLAIGSFGPKPIAVAAQFVAQELRRIHGALTDVQADVLNSRGSQYLSPYSLGAGDISAYRYEPENSEI